MGSVGFDEIRRTVGARASGEPVSYAKREMPELPSEFSPTLLGTPNWIARPGAVAQYRAPPALHAYELKDGWEVHRDQYDPRKDPLGHFFFDAPELPIAGVFAALAGIVTYFILDRKENEKPESERNPWITIGVAIAIAAIVGIVAYVLAALARVAFGVV